MPIPVLSPGGAGRFTGTLRSFRLESDNVCYGRQPDPDEITKHSLSVLRDGRCRISFYRYGDQNGPDKIVTLRETMSPEHAEQIFRRLEAYFSSGVPAPFLTDVGSWDLTLVSTEGGIRAFSGALVPDDGELSELSDLIRDGLHMGDLFCFDGQERPDLLEYLRADYRRVTEGPSSPDVYTERLTVDLAAATIEYIRQHGGDEIRQLYRLPDILPAFLYRNTADYFLDEPGEDPPDALRDPRVKREYRIEAHFRYTPLRVLTGVYDSAGLPSGWHFFMERLRDLLTGYGAAGEMTDPAVFGRPVRRRRDLMFVFVRFGGGSREYSYLCNDDTVSEGDAVTVPVGGSGQTAEATVTRIEFRPENEAPYPVKKIRTVIGKAEKGYLI